MSALPAAGPPATTATPDRRTGRRASRRGRGASRGDRASGGTWALRPDDSFAHARDSEPGGPAGCGARLDVVSGDVAVAGTAVEVHATLNESPAVGADPRTARPVTVAVAARLRADGSLHGEMTLVTPHGVVHAPLTGHLTVDRDSLLVTAASVLHGDRPWQPDACENPVALSVALHAVRP